MNHRSPPEFRYRYVPYGTCFSSAAGRRNEASSSQPAGELCENEIVTDVGGVCWGYDGATLPVIDHHFARDQGQFPAAACAVLHHAERIVEHFRDRFDLLWLVSHRAPDFDAFASLYLVRSLLDGSLPAEGWESYGLRRDGWFGTRQEIAWFRPDVAEVPDNRRWALLLAAAAARIDNCQSSRCPRHHQLNAVLYAAILRGRPYHAETSGACEFFDEVRHRLCDTHLGRLDPYFDSVLTGSARFAPEMAFLDREPAAYQRDLQRARKFVAFLPESTVPFSVWYDEVRRTPLLDPAGRLAPIHAHPPHQRRSAVDGLMLRDPESLLFKEWARQDRENSSLGQGFLFTGIAYSHDRPQATQNHSDYFFSLDLERAGTRHLYPVWARLQEAELGYLRQVPPPPEALELNTREQQARDQGRTCCRSGFEERAAGYAAFFDDPWFDGVNYRCTIIPTPNRGTWLGPAGVKPDLSDDPVAALVERELTEAVFHGPVTLVESRSGPTVEVATTTRTFPALHEVPSVPAECLRLVHIGLDPDANLIADRFVEQVGVQLWRQLDAECRVGVPTDFRERHLIRASDWVAVWSRRGCAIAAKPAVHARVSAWQQLFVRLCELVRRERVLLARMNATAVPAARHAGDGTAPPPTAALVTGVALLTAEALAREAESLLCDAVQLRQDLAVPENALMRRFFEASRLDDLIALLRDLNGAAVEREHSEEARNLTAQQNRIAASLDNNVHTLVSLQQKVEYVEIGIVLVYSAELMHILGHQFEIEPHWTGGFILGFSALAALTTAWGLQPWAHHDHASGSSPRFSRTLVALLVLLLLSLTAFLGWAPRDPHSHSSPPPNQAESSGH